MKQLITFLAATSLFGCETKIEGDKPINLSGIYPHLAYYNNEGECGTGAVVPWSDRLWVITYGPHLPLGSSDKLYEITPDLKQIVREESIGGTPANRMIHPESNQLFIGPYAIDNQRNVRAIPYDKMPGRHTGNARHLFQPTEKIYYATMEEGFYEVDVRTLEVNTLFPDANHLRKEGDMQQFGPLLPGAHGKGLYSGQGVLVYSNNGEASQEALKKFDIQAGALAEWDGKDWKVVRRNQFVEVTGPGGIYGNEHPQSDPIWATGWDHKSVLLGVRNAETGWSFYRLPKASHSYDGAHGWNTEWPRIRDVGTPDHPELLMTMHGMFWHFPKSFTANKTAGIRPRSAYLKVIGDFARWNDQLVFGCDDSANKEFLNKRKVKGSIEGPGQSNSNLWFTSVDQPDHLGPNTAEGAVWMNEQVKAHEVSEPFLFAGWPIRSCWLLNQGTRSVNFVIEVDKDGSGHWETIQSVEAGPGKTRNIHFAENTTGEWVRIKSGANTTATAQFFYADKEERELNADPIFKGMANVKSQSASGGLLYGLGNKRKALGIAVTHFEGSANGEYLYYELDEKLNLVPKNDPETLQFITEKFTIPKDVITVDKSSVLVVDDQNRRWRLPRSNESEYDRLIADGALRLDREVATERDLLNCHGTFYELPAENADGFAKIRPIASHHYRIHDYASYRGLLVMTGLKPEDSANPHVIVSDDRKAAVWAGVIDDLWKMGKPTGQGGPWKDSEVRAGEPSDPYLIGFYDDRSLELSHDNVGEVTFSIEVDPVGDGPWMLYKEITVAPREKYIFNFPKDFQSRWVRFKTNKPTNATAWLIYK